MTVMDSRSHSLGYERGGAAVLIAFCIASGAATQAARAAAPGAVQGDVTTPETCVAGGGYVQWENPNNHNTYFGETDCKFPLGSPQNPYPTVTNGALQAQMRARLAVLEQQRLAAANAAREAQEAAIARRNAINAGISNTYGQLSNMIGAYQNIQDQNAAEQAQQQAEQAQQAAVEAERQAQAAALQAQQEAQDAARRQTVANPFGPGGSGGVASDNPFDAPAPASGAPVQVASNTTSTPFDTPQAAATPPLILGDPREADTRPAVNTAECDSKKGQVVNVPGNEFCVVGTTWWRLAPAK